MSKPRKILLTTDFSKESLRAFGPIGRMAQDTGAEIRLLHVLPVVQQDLLAGTGYPFALPDLDREIEVAQQQIDRLAGTLPPGVRVTTHVVSGHGVAEHIVAHAKTEGVDLIAHSTHGRTGLRRLALGSIAEAVLQRAEVPTLAFPASESERVRDPEMPLRILLPTDLSEASLLPLRVLSDWELLEKAQLHVLNVVPELTVIPHGSPMAPPMPAPDTAERLSSAKDAVAAMCSDQPELASASQTVLADQDAAQAVARYATDNEIDWITLSTHGRTGWRKLVLGSVAGAILRHSPVPVLSVPR